MTNSEAPTSPRLIYLADPMCSWCWAFSPEIEALRRRFADRVQFELIAGVLRTGGQALSSQQSAKLGIYWQTVMDKTGQEFNVDFKPEPDFCYDTEPACRALVTLRNQLPGREWEYLAALQEAFYVRHQDITRAKVLADLASVVTGVDAEADAEAFARQMQNLEMREQLQNDLTCRLEYGIDGFPTLLWVQAEKTVMLAHGYQTVDQITPILLKYLKGK